MDPILILGVVLFLLYLLLIGLFVWLLADVRREGRTREQRDYERQLQLIAVNQTLANQLPAIATSLQRVEQGLERVLPRP